MKLHVGNLSKQTTDAKLNEIATAFGTPQSATVVVDRLTGTSKGYGFIEFESAEAATAAIAGLDGKEIDGQPIKVAEAKPRK